MIFKTFNRHFLLILLAMFTITFSYTEFAFYHRMLMIKYFGIIIFLYLMGFFKMLKVKKIDGRTFYLILTFGFPFVLTTIFNGGSIGGIISVIAYSIFIAFVFKYSYLILEDKSSVFAMGLGIFLAILISIIITPNALVERGYGRVRIYGGFKHPNTFGASAMASYICFLICLKQKNIKKIYKVGLIALMLLMVRFCILSDSKNAFFCVIIFTLLNIYMTITNKWMIPNFVKLIFLFFTVGIILYKILNGFDSEDMEVFQVRLNSIHEVNTDNLLLFFFGSGFQEMYSNVAGTEFGLAAILIKTGFIGLIIYSGVLSGLFIRAKKENIMGDFLPIFVTFIISCFAESYITNITNTFSITMWILMGAFSHKIGLIDEKSESYTMEKRQV